MVQTPTKASISKGEEVKKMTKFSISYIRVSTKRQTNAEASGIKRQEEEYQRWLCQHPEYKNLDGVEFRDLGVSGRGKNSESGALSIFIREAEKGNLPPNTCLVCSDMSRLTREQPYEGFTLLKRIWDLGHTFAFTEGRWRGDIITGRERGILGLVEIAIDTASTEWERKRDRTNGYHDKVEEMLKKRDLSFFKSRREGEKISMYPFWLNFDENKNEFYIIPKWGNLVRRICDMALTMGAKKIAWKLKKEGIKNVSGSFFAPNTLRQTILDNRSVLGEKIHRSKNYTGIYPPIITPEQFESINSAKEERILKPFKKAPKRKMVNLFQGLIFCSHCGGLMQVAKKEQFKCKKSNQKNGEKIIIQYENIYCDRAKTKRTCSATNSAPYIQNHRNIDNELVILKKISSHRWEEYFTDEKHENDLKIEVEKRQLFLHERNKIEQQINYLKKANIEYLKSGRVVPIELEALQKQEQKKYDELDKKYKRAILDIQNLKRKKTGVQARKDIQKRVKSFIEKERFDSEKREEFNIWLKEMGLIIVSNIEITGSNPRKSINSNYYFDIGIGMFDFITGELRGLNQVEDTSFALGMDIEEVRKDQVIRDEHYKKVSLEVSRDIRFPKAS